MPASIIAEDIYGSDGVLLIKKGSIFVMFKRFYPDIYIDSAYDIDYEGLYNKGYRGIIFDIDKIGDMTAKDYFEDIIGFYKYLDEKLEIPPTYVLETTNGFHFAYHLKNHVFTHQRKALNYLNLIKRGIKYSRMVNSN